MPTCTQLPSRLVVPLRRYVRAFRQGKQMCALDVSTAAPALYGTPLPPAVSRQDPPGTPGWDDSWYGRQTRLTRSPPSHVPAPTSTAARPPPPQRRAIPLSPRASQARHNDPEITWYLALRCH